MKSNNNIEDRIDILGVIVFLIAIAMLCWSIWTFYKEEPIEVVRNTFYEVKE